MAARSSLLVQRDLSLEVPRLLVGAAQPYQTLAGPALTTHFLHQPALLPFQRTAFSHAAVAPLYFHTLLHTLAEFAETPRAVRHSVVRQRHAPKEDFWEAVGTLNCFYFSAQAPRGALGGSAALDQHPAMGAVELVRPSHRKESDVKLTLFDGAHQPIASMLMTGPRETTRTASGGTDGLPDAPSSPPTHTRTALPFLAPPAATAAAAPDGDGELLAVMIGSTRVSGGLYGDVVSMPGGGLAHRAYYRLGDVDATATTGGAEVRRDDASVAPTAAPTAMPPWVLFDCVQRLFLRLHSCGAFGDDLAVASAEGWRVVAHHVVQTEDGVFDAPVDVVCAAPRVQPRYRLPPWRHQLGLPAVPAGEAPCVSLRCEIRQSGRLVSTGVYHFCRW
ncbi:hypothetical protein NESM_000805400 [Novymonas esmeraldas]|uniref:Uncharacterized protein n=1 Tax=Novymonas esmeraldas TaxID=1808958 RepID=A0AAW0EY56_9TRYP